MSNHLLQSEFDFSVADRITEIYLPNLPGFTDDLLLPIIAKLSQPTDQWLTWVSRSFPKKDKLIANNINVKQLRTIQTDDDFTLLAKALNAGNSHTLIAEIAHMEPAQRQKIQQIAISCHTNVIIVHPKSCRPGSI